MASIEESRSLPLDSCYLKHSSPGMGLVVPSPSALIPADRLTAAAATASTSELLELHIRLEWVRRSSGREQTDTDHHTPQPSQPAQQKKAKSQGNKRGWKLGGVAPPLFWGRVVSPPPSYQPPPFGRESWEPWKLGKVWKEAVSQQQSQATGQLRLSNSNQQQQPASNQATSRQTVAPQALAATH